MPIEIRLLGPLEALVDNEPVELGPPQQRTLLALLSLHAGTPVRLGAIEEALWDGDQPRSAAKLVQTYVSRLRKLLGPDSIQFAPPGYILDSGSIVDALRFRELVDRGRLEEALALFGTTTHRLPVSHAIMASLYGHLGRAQEAREALLAFENLDAGSAEKCSQLWFAGDDTRKFFLDGLSAAAAFAPP